MRRRNVIAAGSLVVVCAFLVAGVIYFRSDANVRDDEGPVAAIAVLPFKQISEVKDEKLGLGIADVIIAKLANMENLAVRPTTSIVRFADERSDDLFEIGRKLNVEYVIEGSIQRENGTVRVTTQLYSVSQKKQVWTETFDEEYIDIFALQDSISEKVAQKVAIGLDSKRREFPIKQYTRDADAYQAYSTGLSYWSQHSKIGFESAIPHFERAIERDPHFPLPYAYLADTYGHFAYLQSTITREKALRLGEEMANKALKLDPECAEAMSAKALVLSYRKRGEEAFTLMQRSLKIKPNDSHARHRLAWMYANRGDLETALKEMDKAVELDPQSVYLNVYMANLQYLARKGKESLEFCDKALAVDPDSSAARWRKLHALELLGKYKEIEKELEGSLAHTRNPRALRLFLARVLAESRQMDRARAIYRTTSGNKGNDDNGLLDVGALAALGDNEKALKSLEATVIKHDPDLFIIRFEPILDPIRNDPRYQALVRDLAISEGWNADS